MDLVGYGYTQVVGHGLVVLHGLNLAGILVRGNSVDLAVNLHGVPVSFGNQSKGLGGVLSQQLVDGNKGFLSHIINITDSRSLGIDNVSGLAGHDDSGNLLLILITRYQMGIQCGVDLLLHVFAHLAQNGGIIRMGTLRYIPFQGYRIQSSF